MLGPRAPSAWHLVYADSLTRERGFWHEFWVHYDRVANYWRLKKLGAQVSPYAYLAACLVSLRKRQLPRLLATLYGWLVRLKYICHLKNSRFSACRRNHCS